MNIKSLDTGEGYLIAAERKEGEMVFTIERNIFFSCDSGNKLYERIEKSDLFFLKSGGRIVVFGEDALSIARKLESDRDAVRPLYSAEGPAASEEEILAVMVEAVLQKPSSPADAVIVCGHSQAVDGPFDSKGHAKTIEKLAAKLGFRPSTVNRAAAVLSLGPLEGDGALGEIDDAVSVCFSEELVDVAVKTRGRSVIEFSSVRGGRWIDQSVAKMRETSPLVVERIREHDLDLEAKKPQDKVSMMVSIYVEHMIQYVLQMIAAQVRKSGTQLPGAMDAVLSGKLAAVSGFEAKFAAMLKTVDLPFHVRQIKLCPDPMRAAAGGALVQMLSKQRPTAEAAMAPPQQRMLKQLKVNALFGPAPAPPPAAPPAAPQPRPAARAAAPPPYQAPAPAAPPADSQAQADDDLLRKIRILEDRIADMEDASRLEDAGYVEKLRRAAGISAQGATADFRPPQVQFDQFFKKMVDSGASDLFLSAGSRPAMRVDGSVKFLSGSVLASDFCRDLVEALARKPYKDIFARQKGIDLAVAIENIGRFRANFFHQRGNLACVFRYIKKKVPSFEELNLPAKTLMKLAKQRRGMILVTGVAGSGKSTAIAAMIEYINQTSNRHIVTVEDPIEFIFDEKQSVIDQREVGFDTANFVNALKSVVRQSPDVIFIGEMRDKETMEASISAAETGHLVLSTLHTVNAQQTVERIITFFPPHQHALIRMQLSMVLAGVVSLRLLPKKTGGGRAPAVEIMLSTPTIKDLLLEGKTNELYSAISNDQHFGNQTFNESLKGLYQSGVISLEEALAAADNPDELKLEIRGISRGTKAADFDLG